MTMRIILFLILSSFSAYTFAGLFPYEMILNVDFSEQNLTDEDVRAIKRLVDQRYPGAMVMIGGSTEGCKCEEGPECTSQVVVAGRLDGENYEMALSKVGLDWEISKEWLARDRITQLIDQYLKTGDDSFALQARDLYEPLIEQVNECRQFNKRL
ncbi:MAG: hypothetical protein P1U78_01835 [Alcanivoracaceae bacterium]|nr:hypothetical protein [Alcanivoracaceae bacterium]